MNIIELFRDPETLPYLLGAASFFFVVLFWFSLTDDNSAERRLKILERRRADLRSALSARSTKGEEAKAFAKSVVDRFKLAKGEGAKGAQLELVRAGFRSKDAIFIYMFFQMVMPAVGFAASFFVLFVLGVWDTGRENLWIAVMSATVLLGALPSVYLRQRKKNRMRAMLKSLPDGLDLFVICAEAGLSLDATFERVSQEIEDAHPDLADEFGLTAVELGFMPERARALQGLSERCPLPGVTALVSTLIQTERYGTPLAVAMRVLSAELRNERMMIAEEKAARLPAVMTVPMILFILPPLFIVLMGPAIITAYQAFDM